MSDLTGAVAPDDSPFGRATRLRILAGYFAAAGEVTAGNAWEHVYRCLLWMNESAGLAHIYDSNHMQPGKVLGSGEQGNGKPMQGRVAQLVAEPRPCATYICVAFSGKWRSSASFMWRTEW